MKAGNVEMIQRALEVHALTGRPLSHLQRESLRHAAHPGDLALVLAPRDRAVLDPALACRFDRMLRAGLVDEVERRQHRAADALEDPLDAQVANGARAASRLEGRRSSSAGRAPVL